jgi:hypothetical protein
LPNRWHERPSLKRVVLLCHFFIFQPELDQAADDLAKLATEALILVATSGRPTMLAQIGILRARWWWKTRTGAAT